MYINEECIILVHKHDCEHNWGKGEIELFGGLKNECKPSLDNIMMFFGKPATFIFKYK